MKAYPLELRQRIVAAVDQQQGTIAEIAELFAVTERYVYKLLKLRRDTGGLALRPHGGGAKLKLDEPKLLVLAELVADFPDATLEELRELLRRRCRVQVSLNTVWRAVQAFPRKKRAAGRARPARRRAPALPPSK